VFLTDSIEWHSQERVYFRQHLSSPNAVIACGTYDQPSAIPQVFESPWTSCNFCYYFQDLESAWKEPVFL